VYHKQSYLFIIIFYCQVRHQEGVEILSAQTGNVSLEVQYVASEDSDDDNSLADDMYGFRYVPVLQTLKCSKDNACRIKYIIFLQQCTHIKLLK
jgi:hypothetical protein